MIIVDMESSGLDPYKHSLLSVGAVEFEKPENQFYEECQMWEGAHVDARALEINGFTFDQIHDPAKKSENNLLNNFIFWAESCGELTIAGQNPSTDRDFLRAAALRYHTNWSFAFRVVDLHSVAYLHMKERGIDPPVVNKHSALNLDTILKYVGMPEEPKPHNGLRGAKLEAEAFSRLFYSKLLFREYSKYPIPFKIIEL